jgi:hypothetical protein
LKHHLMLHFLPVEVNRKAPSAALFPRSHPDFLPWEEEFAASFEAGSLLWSKEEGINGVFDRPNFATLRWQDALARVRRRLRRR